VARDETAELARAFGAAVREQRERLGLSQEEFGFQAGLDRTYVSGVERGVRNPTLRIVLRVCRALDVRPSTLMRRAEDAAGMRG
jgi:transcriptional regulator with XRE-family HTH domain